MHAARKRQSGFTLIELMIVVGIMGVLTAIAIPSFGAYLKRSKTAEAYTFLGDIRVKQEAYRSEFNQYCEASASATAYWPASTPTDDPVDWGNPGAASGWAQLGARPDAPVRFRYAAAAGPPATTPADRGFGGALGYTGNDFWHAARAVGDLDQDGTFVTFETYSESATVWVSDSKGWD